MKKLKKKLESAGAKVSNLVKVTVFLRNMSDFKKMNQAYTEFFEQNGVSKRYPARTTVEANCPLSYGLIEIDTIAVL